MSDLIRDLLRQTPVRDETNTNENTHPRSDADAAVELEHRKPGQHLPPDLTHRDSPDPEPVDLDLLRTVLAGLKRTP